jgi:hypothetical protein
MLGRFRIGQQRQWRELVNGLVFGVGRPIDRVGRQRLGFVEERP